MMLYPPMKDLLRYATSHYLLVNIIAQRARRIAVEAEESGSALTEKAVTLALREIAQEANFEANKEWEQFCSAL